MCWHCGSIRPYDGPKQYQLQDRTTYMYDGIVYRAIEIQLDQNKDADEILHLIDMGIIANLTEENVGWQELYAFPPFDSSFFTRVEIP